MRSGAWVTPERARLWAIAALIASLAGLLYVLATAQRPERLPGPSHRHRFFQCLCCRHLCAGRPAGGAVRRPQPTRTRVRRQIFGAATPFYGWHYPPFFLFIAAMLALLICLPALQRRVSWHGTTLALLSPGVGFARSPAGGSWRRGASRSSSPIAFPAVFVNLGHGHNGFLTAALMGLALLLLDRRPIVSGILFGLLAYKPQFGLLIPLVLIATGRWKTFASRRSPSHCSCSLRRSPSAWRSGPLSSKAAASRATSCSKRAAPAGTKSRAYSPGRACGARRLASPIPFKWL